MVQKGKDSPQSQSEDCSRDPKMLTMLERFVSKGLKHSKTEMNFVDGKTIGTNPSQFFGIEAPDTRHRFLGIYVFTGGFGVSLAHYVFIMPLFFFLFTVGIHILFYCIWKNII